MMKTEFLKSVVYILLAISSLGAVIISINAYFAKTLELRAVDTRLELKIEEDRVFQQEQLIQQMTNLRVFEQRDPQPLTPLEEEALTKAEERLDELEQSKNLKLEQYEKRMAK